MRVIGIGIETADMLVKEILSRNLRDRRAVARYGGLTGSPDESRSSVTGGGFVRLDDDEATRARGHQGDVHHPYQAASVAPLGE
jgi:transposase